MKMCEQILKKKTAPQYNSNSLNCKNQEHRNIASLSLQLRSYKNTAPQCNSNSLNWEKTTMSPITAAIASRLLKRLFLTFIYVHRRSLTWTGQVRV